LDRIDIQVDVPPVRVADLMGQAAGESSETVAARVAAARDVQTQRGKGVLNARLSGEDLEQNAPMAEDARALFHKASETLKLSARAYHRLWRVARTIADLDGAPPVLHRSHVAEALTYRRLTTAS
ncbi:MAG: ATP-binding protein, partial [Alphaproteobacteria bacterium]|nr:ATP-binding protein [Alphaproteobacteria bacterium]